ncbi:MAG: acetamidase/formamidase family protein [Fimbriimonas sp.]
MATHSLRPSVDTLHGRFDPDLVPVLRVASGDTIEAQTPDAGWRWIAQQNPFAPSEKYTPRISHHGDGHCLLGPVYVEGLAPGDTLEVEILELRPGRWGWCSAAGWDSEYNRRMGLDGAEHRRWQWKVDPDALTAVSDKGHEVALRPFLGLIGMPPATPGEHPTDPPRRTGGNLDCRELVAGTRLFLPVEVAGGLLSFGDGHGVQGDGEVAGPALEIPMERVVLRLTAHRYVLPAPRAITPTGRVAFGFHEDLQEAMYAALNEMLDWIQQELGVLRAEAAMIASLQVSLRVTQIVNGVKGVHALWPVAWPSRP